MSIQTVIEAVHAFLDAEVTLERRRTEEGDTAPQGQAFEHAKRRMSEAMRDAVDDPSERSLVTEAQAYLAAATAFETARKSPAGSAEVAGPARRLERAQQSLQGVLNRYAREARHRPAGPPVCAKRVLVAVDGSLPSQWAVETAGRLAVDLGATLKLIHVRPSQVDEGTQLERACVAGDEAQSRDGELLLHDAQLRLPGDLESSVLQRWGDAAVEIVGAARRWGADFIVVGTRGRGRVSRFVLGSTADSVVRLAPCPVITVSHAPPSPDPSGSRLAAAAERAVVASGP